MYFTDSSPSRPTRSTGTTWRATSMSGRRMNHVSFIRGTEILCSRSAELNRPDSSWSDWKMANLRRKLCLMLRGMVSRLINQLINQSINQIYSTTPECSVGIWWQTRIGTLSWPPTRKTQWQFMKLQKNSPLLCRWPINLIMPWVFFDLLIDLLINICRFYHIWKSLR